MELEKMKLDYQHFKLTGHIKEHSDSKNSIQNQ
jgi:hypothetical protein